VDAVLREASLPDVGPLAALQAEARGGSERDWSDRIAKTLARERGTVVLAHVDEAIVGYANVAFLPEHTVDGAPGGYYLTGVTVARQWRRRGLGRSLTRWRMDWAWERDTYVWCFVSTANRASIDLHRVLGFSVVRSGSSFQGISFDAGTGVLMSAHRSPRSPV